MVPDHHEITGALGAAAIAAEHMNTAQQTGVRPQSKFKGFENLIKAEYTVESFTCEHCSNHCEIKKVQLVGAEPLYYGSRCDRYNLKKKDAKKKPIQRLRISSGETAGVCGTKSKKKTGLKDRQSRTNNRYTDGAGDVATAADVFTIFQGAGI